MKLSIRLVFVVAVVAGLSSGCAHPSLSRAGFVPPEEGVVSIEFAHEQTALASQILMTQPQANITLKDDASGRRVRISNVQWGDDVLQLLEAQGMTVIDSPDGWTDYRTTTVGAGFDDIESVEFQLNSVLPPLHWNADTDPMTDFPEFSLLERVACELSPEGTWEYSYEANTITIRDRSDRIAIVEQLITEEEQFAQQ